MRSSYFRYSLDKGTGKGAGNVFLRHKKAEKYIFSRVLILRIYKKMIVSPVKNQSQRVVPPKWRRFSLRFGTTVRIQKMRLMTLPGIFSCLAILASAAWSDPQVQMELPDTSVSPAASGQDDAPDSSTRPVPLPKKEKHSELADTVRYESDKIEYDAENRILRLSGHSKVAYQDIQLNADTIIYTMQENLFSATGNPMLIEGKDTTVGDFMAYNIKTKRGRVRHATTHVEDAYFCGQKIVKSEKNELYVDQGDYTTCALVDTPHFYFYGERIRLIPNDKIISRPVVLNIGGAPVAALPYFIFPIERNRKSGILTPVWGGNPAGGGYIDNVGYYYTPNDYIDFTTRARIREFSEFVFEAASHYSLRYRLDGGISARYAFNADFLRSSRQWAIDYSHRQNITPDGQATLSGRGNLVSTKNFYSSFSQDSSELREQLLTANLSLTKQFQALKGSGSMVWNRTHDLSNEHTVDDIPSVTFNLFDRALIPPPGEGTVGSQESDTSATRWFNNIYWGYSGRGLARRDAWGGDSDRKDFFKPGIANEIHVSAPQKFLKYITISPNASANLATFYGYIDTTVLSIDTSWKSNTYETKQLSDTGRFAGYTTLRIDTIFQDSAGYPDTVYRITRQSPPIITPVRDTTDTVFTNVLGWRTGVSMSTNLYGLFPIRIMNFAGLRHTFSPSISYNYVPEHNLDKTFYQLGIPYESAHKKQQNVTLSLGNQFHGKILKKGADPSAKPVEEKFSILSAGLSTSYNFEAEGKKWSDLSVNASTGYRFLGLNFGSTFWLYDQADRLGVPTMQRYNFNLSTGSFKASGKLWDGDRLLLDSLREAHPVRDRNAGPQSWQLSITPAYSYSASRTRQDLPFVPSKTYNLSASAGIGLTRNWKMNWNGNYNFITDQMVQNSINLSCDLECWDLRFQWRPEKLNPGYYFIINVKKIPEIKFEQRDRY
jgi:lipopolysaccharide assembly outer membrane protein LptD (OstA)